MRGHPRLTKAGNGLAILDSSGLTTEGNSRPVVGTTSAKKLIRKTKIESSVTREKPFLVPFVLLVFRPPLAGLGEQHGVQFTIPIFVRTFSAAAFPLNMESSIE
jgi:hypothetical protein